jgi:hypothetical protein
LGHAILLSQRSIAGFTLTRTTAVTTVESGYAANANHESKVKNNGLDIFISVALRANIS